MNKRTLTMLISTVLIIVFALTGCGNKIDYSLPDNPILFENGTVINPNDSDDTYLSIKYEGRTYIPYGTLSGTVTGKDIGECLGFIVQDGLQMEDVRIFLLAEDPEANYLARFETEGVMSQPEFFRAIDTIGKEVNTPDFITDLGYDIWQYDSLPELTDMDQFYNYEVTRDYVDIRDLDEAYDTGSAQMDNCFVVGAMVHNDNLYYEFMEKSRENENAFIRVVQSTTEGDAIIYDVLHVAGRDDQVEEVQLVRDYTRDKFASEHDRTITLTHFTGTMEYEKDGHLYWVAYRGEPDEVSLDDGNTFVLVFIN